MADKKLLLVDTNVISHALTENQTPAYARLFDELRGSYRFLVNGFTKYELTCTTDKVHRMKVEEYIEQDMAYTPLNKAVMDFSARLHYLYLQHPSTKGQKITMGDIVNAAVAIAAPCDVLTIDNNDYPTPFFAEVARKRVSYESKRGNKMTDVVCVLRPDIKNVKECFSRHEI